MNKKKMHMHELIIGVEKKLTHHRTTFRDPGNHCYTRSSVLESSFDTWHSHDRPLLHKCHQLKLVENNVIEIISRSLALSLDEGLVKVTGVEKK